MVRSFLQFLARLRYSFWREGLIHCTLIAWSCFNHLWGSRNISRGGNSCCLLQKVKTYWTGGDRLTLQNSAVLLRNSRSRHTRQSVKLGTYAVFFITIFFIRFWSLENSQNMRRDRFIAQLISCCSTAWIRIAVLLMVTQCRSSETSGLWNPIT